MSTNYSAVIIAKNEATSIAKTIIALKNVTDDIIIVLDDRSDDGTEEICINLGVRIFKKTWEGYSQNKNYGVDFAKHDWIFCFDADEVIDNKLISSLKQLIPDISCVYEMNIKTWFSNYPVKFCGWFPDWNIRLYNKTVMKWNGKYVHEKLISEFPLQHKKIVGLVNHFSFRDEEHMIQKFDYYAKLRAGEWIKAGKKPSILKRLFGPYFRFFRTYILKLGLLDGKYGFIIANQEYILKKKELLYWKSLIKST